MMKKLLCTLTLLFFALGVIQAQEDIEIVGNGTVIVDGQTAISTADDTDYGTTTVGTPVTNQFTINNTGTSTLFISLPPSINDLGTGTADFSTTSPSFSVPAAGSTTFDVTFDPSVAGVQSVEISVTSSDPDESPYTFNIGGTGTLPIAPDAEITGNGTIIVDGQTAISTTDDTNFGTATIGTPVTKQYTINNTGTATLFISLPPSINDLGTGTSDFSTTNPAFSVPAAGTTTFDVTFNPTVAGAQTVEMSITSNDPDESPYTFNIGGTGTLPIGPDIEITGNGTIIVDGQTAISASDDTDFGSTPVGIPVTRQFTINNTGTSALFISTPPNINDLGTGTSDFSTTNPAFSVPAAGSTTFDVTFNPSVAGAQSVEISVTSSDVDESPYTFNVGGTGITPVNPDIEITGNGTIIVDGQTAISASDDTDFGSTPVGTPVARQFTINNTGASTLFVSLPPGINDLGTGTSDFSATNPAFSVPPAGTTTFDVTFNPSVAGAQTVEISITSNDPDENPYTFNIGGIGTAVGVEMDVTGLGNPINDGDVTTSITNDTDFGSVDVSTGSVTHTFTIENNGTLDLNLTDPSPYVTITGIDAADFTLVTVPTSPIVASSSTTFNITFDPTGAALTTRNALVTIANDDADENPYTFAISGTAIDGNTGSPLMITQYYEGEGNDQWIEVKNISTQTITAGVYNLCLYTNTGTRQGVINTTAPAQSVGISGAGGAILPGEVILFYNDIGGGAPALPAAGNLGSAHTIPTTVCNFTGNDVILISTSTGTNSYNDRIDIVGVVPPPSGFPPNWGLNKSLIKGCGTTQQPSLVFDQNDFIELFLDEVNAADPDSNIALGTQLLGITVWTTSWSNGTPGRTRNAIINGTYNATDGSFGACNLTINGNLNFNSGTSNYVEVNDNLIINGTFTIGDQESLYSVNVLNPGTDPVSVTGSITKLETTTTLNDSDDYTFWSSPVENANISTVFAAPTYQQTRLFYWDQLAPNVNDHGGSEALGEWLSATGLTMKPGKGYISQSPQSDPYPANFKATVSFSGTPNNGSVDLDASDNDVIFNNNGNPNDDLNLVGNPYPSAIDAIEFINDGNNAISINGTLWFWTHKTPNNQNPTGEQYTNDDYASYNLLGGLSGGPITGGLPAPSDPSGPIPNGIIGSGQGFMVQTNSTIQKVSFTDGMRVKGQNTQFFRGVDTKKSSAEERDRIWLNAESSEGGAFSQILVGFVEDATDGFDRVYDGIKISEGHINLYSKIDTLKYGIQGLSSFSVDKKVPLAFNTYIEDASITYTISIHRFEGESLRNNDIYLFDNELNVIHDLKQGAYNFTAATGSYDNRFTLQFTKTTLGVDDLELNNNFVVVNEENALLVKSNTVVSQIKMYDITGRLLVNMLPNESEFRINTHNIRKGTVLILNTTFENGTEISKKAIKY
ncbi:choice-of-anchor D domain-containing protein [Aureibaculum sp. 2210JD6-5]|uniref:beta strand repeat-containing protein n=1 Tax=Aureibaculum sp. 2210JD6-5 TaxID=3103957 RepID=UPI002AAEF8B0|nr:choice-of-anchor D domain-containing protein [Aureibaculum sp. 2210JD6-5]MDY7395181.1 choice-of-anchor D domain-containing protein [Aureibaculum sp. 2210JD6-5]